MEQPSGTSGKAVAALILGLLSFCLNLLAAGPALILGIASLRDIGRSQGRLGGNGLAISGIVLSLLGLVVSSVGIYFGYSKVRETAARINSTNAMRSIGVAAQNYASKNNDILPHDIYSKDGKPLLSWRVAVLPELDQEELYKQFHLDEPWDSPNNKPLLAQMPKVYACPWIHSINQARASGGGTYYQGIDGPGAIFGKAGKRTFQEIENGNGAKNTWLVVVAEEPVPWTKPSDLPYGPNKPLPGIKKLPGGAYQVLFADGHVEMVPATISEEMIRRAIVYKKAR
jgi:prepilin-type processing-associated H-X9-DG protein